MQRVTIGDLASRQAVTRSERRAGLETDNAGADPFASTGKAAIVSVQSRVKPAERQTPRSRRGNDDGRPAQESNATREAPTVEAWDLQLEAREGQIQAVRGDGKARSTDEAG